MATENKNLQIKRATAASWTSDNPTLLAGEIGFESDTYKIKIGDGATAWNSLAYLAGTGVGGGGCITCDEQDNIYGGDGAMGAIIGTAFESVAIGPDAIATATEPFSSIAIGWHALQTTVTTSETICIGWESGAELEDTSYDVYVGRSTGRGAGAGSSTFGNTGIGSDAMFNINQGGQNTCIGAFAGYDITDAWLNTCIGSNAGFSLTTGEYNTFLGTDAGLGTVGGNENTFVGYGAGNDVLNGSGNTFIGYLTGYTLVSDTSNKLGIDANGPTNLNMLIYGEFDTRLVRTHVSSFAVRYQSMPGFTTDAFDSFRIDGSTTAGETRMLVYDVDNNTLERVTVGAPDSGGAGFKVLRIPN